MTKVTLIKTSTCPYCPSASKLFKELQKEHKFEYEEIDAITTQGQNLVQKYGIMSVPAIIIDGKLKFIGVPKREDAIKAIKA